MLSRIKLEQLYQSAKQQAFETPRIGCKLAGNCTSVNYAMLQEARECFGADVRLVVGWFEMWGQKQFYFSDATLQKWLSGEKNEEYSVHCWLAKGSDVIDLTLAATIHEKFTGDIPAKTTYIDSRIAKKLRIKYFEKLSGDDVLHRLNFQK